MSRAADAATVAAFRVGWRALRALPERLAYSLFDAVADVVTRRGGPSVERLRANYARIRPDLTDRELDDEVRQGVRSYLRYYCEAFRLPAMSGERIDRVVRTEGLDDLTAELRAGRPVLAFLGHTGNWDLAGAWCARHLGTVVTVAERLEPEEMFTAFLDFREGLGMRILPAEKGVYGQLRAQLQTGEPVVMPLLADRDLTATGVAVDLRGHRAQMAAGTAALAIDTGVRLWPVTMRHERVGDTWGMVIHCHDEVLPTPGLTHAEQVAAMTQQCADALGEAVAGSPRDWHMMQRVFHEDLDLDRLPT
ncbi:phosphatidylinositol mannoside acyltransferase [Janibacter sp. GXQ6167]|uniref:phosphatidylinositol mannoside acyltransferase n=1 Tax=Janibacter sp. GXQ6167 TaxID=3240791 RepID=UPI003524A79B